MKLKILLSFLLISLVLCASDDTVSKEKDVSTKSTDDANITDTDNVNKTESKGSGKLPTSLGKKEVDPKDEEADKKKNDEDAKKPKISLNFLDAPLADISWCGTDKETMFILTEKGSLYTTTDAGESWSLLNDHLIKEGLKEVDSRKKVGDIIRMIPSPVDKSLYIFLGTEGVNWITTDCGKKIKAINHGRPIHEFIFHPTEKNWVLASAWTKCEDPTQESCKTYKELFFSDDLCEHWKLLANYVVQFQWAFIDYSFTNFVPKERIILSHEPKGKGNQKLSGWSEKIQVSMSDDFFATSKLVVPKGNKFLVTKTFFFVVQVSDESEQDVTLLVGQSRTRNYNLKSVQLPNQRLREHSYTILDSSEGQIFLHINHEGSKSTYGNIYISDSTGTRYSLSLGANVRNYDGQCDFEKVQGLEGIYLSNVYEKEQLKRIKAGIDTTDTTIPTEKTSGKKSTPAPHSRNPLSENNLVKQLVEFKKTVISFNKGGMWTPLTPPLKDANDKKIICPDIETCSLHLHSISNTRFGPFYSTENSLGIILGTGNVGTYLTNREDEINTYLSRDGGLTWFEIRKGSHIYEIGDHGSLIVVSPDQFATTEVFYTWNEGLTWQSLKISDEPIEVTNIITEPSNTAEKFIVYGRSTGKTPKGVVLSIDFVPIHQRWCKHQDKPQLEESDYELWTPNGKISPHCLLGHKTTYVRRKREAQCFNSEEWDRWFFFELCECTEEDYECDVGFSRKGNGPCLPDNGKPVSYDPPEQCDGFYYVTQGYRKVAGNTCRNGVNHDYVKLPCPGFSSLSRSNLIMLVALMIVIIGLVLGTNKTFAQKCKDCRDSVLSIFVRKEKKPTGKGGYKGLDGQDKGKDDEDFNQLFFDNEHDDSAEPVEDKTLIEMGKGKKRMTSGNALEMAKKNVPVLSKPAKEDTNLIEFNPRS